MHPPLFTCVSRGFGAPFGATNFPWRGAVTKGASGGFLVGKNIKIRLDRHCNGRTGFRGAGQILSPGDAPSIGVDANSRRFVFVYQPGKTRFC